MKRCLMLLCAIGLTVATAPGAEPKKGDVFLEFQAGWATEDGMQATDVDSFNAGGTGGDPDGWFISGGINLFTSDRLQIGIAGIWADLEATNVTGAVDVAEPGFPTVPDAQGFDVDSEISLYGVGGRAKWHFKKIGKWTPFIGVQGFWVTGDIDITGISTGPLDPGAAISETIDADGLLWGPVAGARIPLSTNNTLLVEYQYHMWDGDIADALDSGHAVSIGLARKFK